jgi:hypothetical protein
MLAARRINASWAQANWSGDGSGRRIERIRAFGQLGGCPDGQQPLVNDLAPFGKAMQVDGIIGRR